MKETINSIMKEAWDKTRSNVMLTIPYDELRQILIKHLLKEEEPKKYKLDIEPPKFGYSFVKGIIPVEEPKNNKIELENMHTGYPTSDDVARTKNIEKIASFLNNLPGIK